METVNQILNVVPQKYHAAILVVVVLAPIVGRVYHTIVNGGGLRHIWQALIFGVNVTSKEQDKTTTTTEQK